MLQLNFSDSEDQSPNSLDRTCLTAGGTVVRLGLKSRLLKSAGKQYSGQGILQFLCK